MPPSLSSAPPFELDPGQEGVLKHTTTDQVVRLIRRDIQRGVLTPGQRLRQRDIATQFGVSTTPVREAFQALREQGFVRTDPHRGTVVVRPSAAEIREAYEIRKALEGLAIATAVPKMSEETWRDADKALEGMRSAGARTEWVALNHDFHLCLYEPAGMPSLLRLIASLRDVASYYVEGAYDDPQRRADASADHERILHACRQGQADAARAAVEQHLEHTAALAVREVSGA
jgi:DNA-binding GntR family transcriptional regulator